MGPVEVLNFHKCECLDSRDDLSVNFDGLAHLGPGHDGFVNTGVVSMGGFAWKKEKRKTGRGRRKLAVG